MRFDQQIRASIARSAVLGATALLFAFGTALSAFGQDPTTPASPPAPGAAGIQLGILEKRAAVLDPGRPPVLLLHGATLAGRSLRECVFRSIYACRNAELQSRALGLGQVSTLSPGEVELCGSHSLTPRTLGRAWEYWTRRAGITG